MQTKNTMGGLTKLRVGFWKESKWANLSLHEKIQVNEIRNEKGDTTTDTTDTQRS